ncbi:Cyclic AMP-dependent transcription factor ATF-7 [Haplosporangium sp. Z 767]|nr:Cyclic AMP-dependent transcription factor ATF-7 [Haplosporangium sp. Z 767]
MSLETDIRRDVNPTPTRFLLECGAFTPGFGLSFDNLNPFDASLKFLNTGTPKAEMNPFDSSFRTPSSAISISNNNVTSTPLQQAQHQHIERERSGDRHPWADMIFGGDTMPMPQPSPGLSSSSSSSSLSPSLSPLPSLPTNTVSLDQVHTSSSISSLPVHAHTYEHRPVFGSLDLFERTRTNESSTLSHTHGPTSLQGTIPSSNNSVVEMHHIHNEYRADGPQQDLEDDDQNSMDVDSDNDTAMSVSSFKEPSSASRPRMTTRASSRNASQTNGAKNTEAPSKTTAAAANTSIATPVRKPRGRKRAADNESPEDKRQKFLERNRLAASKCREKKRLATLKIISDADEITTRNQTLHETLRVLQEEVRQLKNQILCHRDCGCDVIQKFVQSTSFDSGASPVSSLPVPSHVQQMRFFETEL